MSEFGVGVVIGKFLPPHKGHGFLIETALSRCERVVVIVCRKPSDPVPGALRKAWLREIHPDAEVMMIEDRYDENDSKVWAENTIRWLGKAPDVVFTSEAYGDAYASFLGSRHVLVDQARLAVPCSGTAVRSDPWGMREFLDPVVRAWFVKRVVVLGAESTGTTTLARDLAESIGEPWVAEYGREYSAKKQAAGDSRWKSDEFLLIANEQTKREDEAAKSARKLLVCDTNAFATVLWHRRYMGKMPENAEDFLVGCRADFYILTGDEIPFVQDGTRDGEAIRHEMHEWFSDALREQEVPWIGVEGTREERLDSALHAIRSLG